MTALLPRAIGIRRARQIAFSGEFIDATRAYEWGLVNEVVAPDRHFIRVVELASLIEGNSATSIESQLQLLTANDGRSLAEALDAELRVAAAAHQQSDIRE
jgi:enoyl-CoA hydratase